MEGHKIERSDWEFEVHTTLVWTQPREPYSGEESPLRGHLDAKTPWRGTKNEREASEFEVYTWCEIAS